MSRITLPPIPSSIVIPPAPRTRDRASSVNVVTARDRAGDGVVWLAGWNSTYRKHTPDVAPDVIDMIGGVQ
jgi:hypothetical protein